MLSILVKTASSFFFLLSGILWKKILTPEHTNYQLIIYRTLASIVFISAAIGIYHLLGIHDPTWVPDRLNATWTDWVSCIAICLFSFWGLYFYTSALKIGRFSFVSAISTVSSLFSFVFASLIHREHPGSNQWTAIIVLIMAFVYHQRSALARMTMSAETLRIFISCFFWGGAFVLYLIPIRIFGVLYFSLILEVCVLVSAMGLLIFHQRRIWPRPVPATTLMGCIAIGAVVCAGSLLNNLALTQMPVVVNILLGLLFELAVVIYGLKALHEKLSATDWVLISAVMLSTCLMALRP